jgi:hypothetical protein
MQPCTGLLGKIFGHSFENIFNQSNSLPSKESLQKYLNKIPQFECGNPEIQKNYYTDIIESFKTHTTVFVHKQCTRCGVKI